MPLARAGEGEERKAMKAKKFPKDMYLKLEVDFGTNDGGYWVVTDTAEDHADMGEKIAVGHYVLKEALVVECQRVVTAKPK